MHAHYSSSAVFIEQRNRNPHFSVKRGIRRFEFIDFNDALIRHELHELAEICISVRRRFAYTA